MNTSNGSPLDLYLELLKRTLTYSLWDENESPLGQYGGGRAFRMFGGPLIVRLLRQFHLKLVREIEVDRSKRELGEDWPLKAHTMIGMKRLDNIQACACDVIRNSVPGDFIETGVWRGGASIFMEGILKAYDETAKRRLWVADSFEGLPANDPTRYPKD
nr:TylF/MycF family methyltransferase [Verrucomicrobiota bacterium]